MYSSRRFFEFDDLLGFEFRICIGQIQDNVPNLLRKIVDDEFDKVGELKSWSQFIDNFRYFDEIPVFLQNYDSKEGFQLSCLN